MPTSWYHLYRYQTLTQDCKLILSPSCCLVLCLCFLPLHPLSSTLFPFLFPFANLFFILPLLTYLSLLSSSSSPFSPSLSSSLTLSPSSAHLHLSLLSSSLILPSSLFLMSSWLISSSSSSSSSPPPLMSTPLLQPICNQWSNYNTVIYKYPFISLTVKQRKSLFNCRALSSIYQLCFLLSAIPARDFSHFKSLLLTFRAEGNLFSNHAVCSFIYSAWHLLLNEKNIISVEKHENQLCGIEEADRNPTFSDVNNVGCFYN